MKIPETKLKSVAKNAMKVLLFGLKMTNIQNQKINIESEDEVIYGETFSKEDETYRDLRTSLIKETLPFLNNALRNFVTLNSAFSAGVVAIYDKGIVNKGVLLVSMIFFIMALTVSVFGIMPFTSKINTSSLTDVKNTFSKGVSWKRNFLYVTSSFFLVGIVLILAGIIGNALANR